LNSGAASWPPDGDKEKGDHVRLIRVFSPSCRRGEKIAKIPYDRLTVGPAIEGERKTRRGFQSLKNVLIAIGAAISETEKT